MAENDDEPVLTRFRNERRKRLLNGLDVARCVGVEIGPLCWPLVRRSEAGEIIYVDHTDTQHLREKYRNDPYVELDEIVDVDAVWGANSLHEAIGGRYVDYVVASHVVEHVPDLVTWLRELASVLNTTGEVRLAVPDRRYTFDYFRRESRLPEVLASYVARARVPQPFSVLDHCLSVTDVSRDEAWRHRPLAQPATRHHTPLGALQLALDAHEHGNYHDVHCWVFTPRSFARLMADLSGLALLDFACEDFSDTRRNDIEFTVTMRRSRDRAYIAESWKQVEQAAHEARPGERFSYAHYRLRELGGEPQGAWHTGRVCGLPSALDPLEPFVFPPNFDATDYLDANPDVRAAGADPVTHYRHFGWQEGRPVRRASAS